MTQFDLLHPHFNNQKLQMRSADGNRLFVFDLSPYHHLTTSQAKDLESILKDYSAALAANVAALERVVEWTVNPDGSFDDLVRMLPEIKRALELAGVMVDETTVDDL